MSVVTPIGLDHQAFLGDTVAAIAETKLRSVRKRAVMAPQPFAEAVETAEILARKEGWELLWAETMVDETERKAIERMAGQRQWPPFLVQNAMTAVAAFKAYRKTVAPIEALKRVRLPGRFELIGDRIRLDVGHNPMAAEAAANALQGRRVRLVYNALADKDAVEVLARLRPVTERVEVIPIDDARAMPYETLKQAIEAVGLEAKPFTTIEADVDYLVFGSFRVVEAFLRRMERT
jgi:dihydrofolate synthase/folylpolyglutamate synthase